MHELVAQARGLLEVELLAGGAHVVLDGGHDACQLVFGQARQLLGHRLREVGVACAPGLGADEACDVGDGLLHAVGLDAVLGVVALLQGAAALRLVDGHAHGVGDGVGVHDHLAAHVARRTAHRLDERAAVAQEPLLVGVEDGHEAHLGDVEALAQQVDAHEDVERPRAQLADDLHTVHRGGVGVHVGDLEALVEQVVGEVLGHALGEGRHQYALMAGRMLAALADEVVDLPADGPYVYLGVEKARGADDLLHGLGAHALLEVAGRGAHEHELRDARLELVEAKRAVVQGARQAEAVLDERDLARAVALVHAAHLGQRHVRLVHDAQHVLGEVVDERVGGLAGGTAVEVARVVLDARAEPHGLQRLEVVVGALLEPLCLEELACLLELLAAGALLLVDGGEGAVELGALGHVVRRRPDGDGVEGVEHLARHLVHLADLLHLVAEEADAHGVLGVGREHVNHVAAHAEGAPVQVVVVAVVEDVDERVHEVVAVQRRVLAHVGGHARIVLGAADAVDAAHGGHDDHVAAAQQVGRGLVAQLLDVLVDGGVLLDVGVGGGDVGLGLVVVVVAHEVHHGVVGEELAQLACHLGGEGLVGLQDERGLAHRLDGLGHGEGLARAGDAQKGLVTFSFAYAGRKLLDCLGLVAAGLEGRDDLEVHLVALLAEALELRAEVAPRLGVLG